MHYIQKSIKDWIIKSLQESILLCDFSDFIEAFDSNSSDDFTIQSQSDYNMILNQIFLYGIASYGNCELILVSLQFHVSYHQHDHIIM